MMKKTWGLMIIFWCCFGSVSVAQEMHYILAGPDLPNLVHTDVDVSIEKNGLLAFQADNALLQGKITMKLTEKVSFLTGDYAGWGYAHLQYKMGRLQGSIYYVFNDNEGRGMITGDVVGVARQVNGLQSEMIWRVAELYGKENLATVKLTFDHAKPGKKTLHQNIWMPVLPDFTLSADGYSQATTVLLLPAPDGNPHNVRKYTGGGLEFGTYQAGIESGTLWSFLDNTDLTDPFSQRRYGTRDGFLAGTSEVFFQKDGGTNTAVSEAVLLVEQD